MPRHAFVGILLLIGLDLLEVEDRAGLPSA
jgi:hypothetical protein